MQTSKNSGFAGTVVGVNHGASQVEGTSTQTELGSVTILALMVSVGFSEVKTFIMLCGAVVDPGYNAWVYAASAASLSASDIV